MLSSILKLQEIAQKPSRTIIGLMSGTSLDGLDIAVCEISGYGSQTRLKLNFFETVPYTDEFRAAVRKVFSKEEIKLPQLTLLNPWIALKHAEMVNSCLQKWGLINEEIDLIASHGQTVYHAPRRMHLHENFGNATLQIGDADHLAVATGIITLGDFRQKNIAAGGEGAPLAVYGDYLLFGNADEDRILLNIGGIANFTYLPGKNNNNKIVCTDIGPGNTLMDAFMQDHVEGKTYDQDAAVAASGMVNRALLHALADHDFFNEDLNPSGIRPVRVKTTGPELFNRQFLQAAQIRSGTTGLSVEDTLATLNKFSAHMIVRAIGSCIKGQHGVSVFVSGGGKHNPLLMEQIRTGLPSCNFRDTEEIGIPSDAKEAVLFALLANEAICGEKGTFEDFPEDIPSVSMGKISFPD